MPRLPIDVPAGGIFITRGMRVSIPRFTISIGPDGAMSTDIALHVSLDICPFWLEIARRHVAKAEADHLEVQAAWQASDNDLRVATLEAEFDASMQAIAATGIAIDAFYARVKEEVQLPSGMVESWRTNNTARYKQVTEVLRRAFVMGPRSAVNLRQVVKEIYKFRDQTVHPPSEARAPVSYPELGVATEWRFFTFRAENARILCGLAISLIAQLLAHPRDPNQGFADHCAAASERISPLLEEWEARYGQLFPREPEGSNG